MSTPDVDRDPAADPASDRPADPPRGRADPGAAPDRIDVTDAARLRALAHPARLAIIDHLAQSGPATATECARVVNLSPSATSYHLRALARSGFVEEADGRGDGRERLWRRVAEHIRVDSSGLGAGGEEAESALIEAVLAWQETRTRHFFAGVHAEPAEWKDASTVSDSTVEVTADELRALVRHLHAAIEEWSRSSRPEPSPGARRVVMMLRAIPAPELAR